MWANGIMIEPKDMEFILILMELVMRDCGLGIYSMGKARKDGQMDQYLKENIKKERKTE